MMWPDGAQRVYKRDDGLWCHEYTFMGTSPVTSKPMPVTITVPHQTWDAAIKDHGQKTRAEQQGATDG